jgi:hypothetical protein
MHDVLRRSPRGTGAPRSAAAAAFLLASMLAVPAAAREPVPFAARAGLEAAEAAARAWAPDARLVYVENDEEVDASGAAARWGYLFHSPSHEASRGYSVRDGRILVAENLPIRFEAPPVDGAWIDSRAAIEAAGRTVARTLGRRHPARLRTMLLMRGAFNDADPDVTTWTLVYAAPGAPSLFVMVDAADGTIRRTWRG